MNFDRRIDKLESENVLAVGKMKAESIEEWRKQNYERIRWEMFLELWGPDSDWYSVGENPASVEDHACAAYKDLFTRALSKYKGHIVDFDPMTGEERAFAFAIEEFFASLSDRGLLSDCLGNYGSDLPSATLDIDLAKMRIEKEGLEWLQITWSKEQQKALEKLVFGEFISENFVPGGE